MKVHSRAITRGGYFISQHQHLQIAALASPRTYCTLSTELPDSRQTIFISHANPADNAVTQWLALRLVREGYEVWCDLTKLLGGTNWWIDIEHAIRQKTRKFVYIVSRASNSADGVLKELSVADTVKRQLGDSEFIIPIKVDDLPYRDHNIYINGLNALTFTRGWATGLADLLRTLQEQSVPCEAGKGPDVIASWWNDHRLNREIIRPEPQTHLTNWFPLRAMPGTIWIWKVPQGARMPASPKWPAYQIRDRYVSFANAKDLTDRAASPTGGRGFQVAFSLDDTPPVDIGLDRGELRTVVKQLLRQAWDVVAEKRKLPLYELSSRRRTLWFPCGSVSPNGTSFLGIDGKRTDRQLCGYRNIGPKGGKYRRFYHYGLEAQPVTYPNLMLAMKAHVIFTLDGNTPHRDLAYQHRSRRNQCSKWWNDRWRDLMLAAMAALADGKDEIELPLCPVGSPLLSTRPASFIAPFSYRDEDVKEPADEHLDSDDDAVEPEQVEDDGGGEIDDQ